MKKLASRQGDAQAASSHPLNPAPVSVLRERRGFFSFAMLAGLSARAAGYARAVPTPVAETAAAPTVYQLRDVLAGKNLGQVLATGIVTASVNTGDTKLFVLTPE